MGVRIMWDPFRPMLYSMLEQLNNKTPLLEYIYMMLTNELKNTISKTYNMVDTHGFLLLEEFQWLIKMWKMRNTLTAKSLGA